MYQFADLLSEWIEWDAFVADALGAQAELFAVSSSNSDQRIYRIGDRIAKVRRTRENSPDRRAASLDDEARIIGRVYSSRETDRQVAFFGQGQWTSVSYNYIVGRPLDQVQDEGFLANLRRSARVMREVYRINRQGISHRDLRLDNILENPDGSIHIIDFDQAVVMHWPLAVLNDFVGVSARGRRAEMSVLKPVVRLSFPRLRPAYQALRRHIGARWPVNRQGDPLQRLPSAGMTQGSEMLTAFREAWELAMHSNATAPGLAYYSITLGGLHFPGERPWLLRWHHIQRAVSFRGKRVLECGCNLGLLSICAVSEGADDARGVDVNPTIITAAKRIALGTGSVVRFDVVNFNSSEAWEQALLGADLVVALSLLQWIHDKDRFLRFLGTHEEILYEGHESLDVETARLHAVGFERVERIFESERGRWLLHGTKGGKPPGLERDSPRNMTSGSFARLAGRREQVRSSRRTRLLAAIALHGAEVAPG